MTAKTSKHADAVDKRCLATDQVWAKLVLASTPHHMAGALKASTKNGKTKKAMPAMTVASGNTKAKNHGPNIGRRQIKSSNASVNNVNSENKIKVISTMTNCCDALNA